MSSFICLFPWWEDGHISQCVKNNYCGLLFPLGIIPISLLLLLGYSCTHRHKTRLSGYGPIHIDIDDDRDGPKQHTGAQPYHITISRRVQLLETFVLLFDIISTFIILIRGYSAGPYGSVILSIYLFVLLVARQYNSTWSAVLQPHSEALYYVQWLCIAFIAHETLVSNVRGLVFIATLVRLGLFTDLILIHWTAPRTRDSHGDAHDNLRRDEGASTLSRLFFSWTDPLLWKAFRTGTLETSDLYMLNNQLSSSVITANFSTKTKSQLSFLWRIFQLLKFDLLRQGAWATVRSVFVFVPPILIKSILEYFEHPSNIELARNIWFYVFGLLISGLIAGISSCQCDWVGSQMSTKVRAIILHQIYSKVLRRRLVRPAESSKDGARTEKKYTSDGAIYNFVSGDINFISMMSGMLYLVWVTFPVQITLGTLLLYQILGISGILGVLIMVALLPLNIMVSKRVGTVQGRLLAAADARIHASNELFNAYRTIKYYAWETAFRDRVLDKRREEMRDMRSRFIWWSINMTIFHSLPFIVTIFTCFLYTIVWKQELGTSIAFPALATFSVIRIPLNRMADSITFLIRAHVSFSRIDAFLQEPETDKRAQLSKSSAQFAGFENASLTWPSSETELYRDEETPLLVPIESPASSRFKLQNLDIRFREQGLNIIYGPSGSGKSSLLLALLGEMQLEEGQVFLPYDYKGQHTPDNFSSNTDFFANLSETSAYCPHEPWILNQSIRANILLGLPFDGPRYEEVLRATALDIDISSLSDGDQTLAGENGSRISGGQKQRVSLARALYSPCRYVLLDDCLSALDSRTARHVFFNAIKGRLMRGRTCILATHHTQLTIPNSDYVVSLEAGRVKALGTPEDMASRGFVEPQTARGKSVSDEDLDIATSPTEASPEGSVAPEAKPKVQSAAGESKAEGAVTWAVISGYLRAMGPAGFWVVVMIGFVAQQLAALGTNLWIKEWAFQYDQLDKQKLAPESTTTVHSDGVHAGYYMAIYAGICLAYALISFIRDLITFSGSLKASWKIYEQLLNSVLFAKLSFFDRPLGQITNRFSTDISVLDQSLASFSVSALQLATTVLMVIVLMLYTLPGGPLLFLVLAVVFLAYYFVMFIYIRCTQDLKRIQAVAHSPLYQHVGETISGYVSIRGYGSESIFTAEHGKFVDSVNQPYMLLKASEQWFGVRVEILSSIIAFATGVFVVWDVGSIDAGAAGLVLTYAATFTENMIWFVQVYAIIQQNLTSVERIDEYISVEQEKTGAAPGHVLQPTPIGWPTRGGVTFHNFTTRYAPHLDPVLHKISFRANPGERVAVVGRTGAGKSSLALALLRVLEVDADDGGSIEIDGVDIATVELAKLRGTAITMIPQDPQLFEGTVRKNLDPLGQHDDAEILDVLRSMKQQQQEGDGEIGLSLELDQPASALSRGQSQLLCVARGLLRKSRVLVLDEATANVDHVADAGIQAGLRASVAGTGATVITIAHRLLTVADYDRVVVLDAGRVVEQGTVAELLTTHRGEGGAIFRLLCEQSGNLEDIRRAAGL